MQKHYSLRLMQHIAGLQCVFTSWVQLKKTYSVESNPKQVRILHKSIHWASSQANIMQISWRCSIVRESHNANGFMRWQFFSKLWMHTRAHNVVKLFLNFWVFPEILQISHVYKLFLYVAPVCRGFLFTVAKNSELENWYGMYNLFTIGPVNWTTGSARSYQVDES